MKALIPENYAEYMDRFNRRDYAEAFAHYRDTSAAFVQELCAAVDLQGAADEAVRYIDSRIKGLWKKRKLLDIQCFLMFYVSPMLLDKQEERAERFAALLKESWIRCHPDKGYEIESYDKIAEGFPNRILGFSIPDGGKK